MSEEVERKYLGVARETLVPLLKALGAQALGGVHFESNSVFDNTQGALRASMQLVRLRTRLWPTHRDFLVTYKRPLPVVFVDGKPIKRREEYELSIDNPVRFTRLLQALGYVEQARYEKIRESWSLAGAHIDLDELSFIHVVEIEAKPADFEALEKQLGLEQAPVSASSYHTLYQEWLQAQGLALQDSFVFADHSVLFERLQLPQKYNEQEQEKTFPPCQKQIRLYPLKSREQLQSLLRQRQAQASPASLYTTQFFVPKTTQAPVVCVEQSANATQATITLDSPAHWLKQSLYSQDVGITVSDASMLTVLLEGLQLQQTLCLELTSEVWRIGETALCLEHLCCGDCLLIEDSAQALCCVEQELGLDKSAIIENSYYSSYQEWLSAQGLLSKEHLVFPEKK